MCFKFFIERLKLCSIVLVFKLVYYMPQPTLFFFILEINITLSNNAVDIKIKYLKIYLYIIDLFAQ